MPARPDRLIVPGLLAAWAPVALRRGDVPPSAGRIDAAIGEADRLRDARRPAEAARAYGEILERLPDRTEIRVQFGNMLKDSGEPRAALDAYRLALAARPDDPDIHLQLGHALKLLGDRAAAVDAYRDAARRGRAEDAGRELAALGEAVEQNRLFAERPWAEALRSVADLQEALDGLRVKLDRIGAALPALGNLLAAPIEAYDAYRAALAIPPPPDAGARTVTVLCLTDGTSSETLARQIASIRAQVHRSWRLLLLGPNVGTDDPDARYPAGEDDRIARIAAVGSPAAAELEVACRQDGPVLLLAPGALLDPHALGWFAQAFDLAEAEAFVCDEEAVVEDEGRPVRLVPSFRQIVDPDTLAERNVFGETVVIAAAALRARRAAVVTTSIAAARASLLLDLARDAAVGHVPFPLVLRAGSADPALPGLAGSARLEARVLSADARIAVVVASRDNAHDVETLVRSLRATAEHPARLDVVLLDNGGRDPASCAILDRLAAQGEIRRIAVDEPFNWSRLNNLGAAAIDAPLLVFANDDMRMLTRGWDARLRTLLARAEVGAVGAKLLYPDGTLQHAGILFGWAPSPTHHDGLHRPGDEPGPAARWAVTRAVSAVTGAFLATRRETFAAVGGFDDMSLPVGYGDIDYALKLRAAGHRILWTPQIALHHHESKTRGLDRLDTAKAARAEAEERTMRLRWPGVFAHDPGVHPAWRPESLPFRLLDPWSARRAAAHIEATGRRRPWLVPPPRSAAT